MSGEGGLILTNNREIANRAKSLSNHGIKGRNKVREFGYLSRMDTLQALQRSSML